MGALEPTHGQAADAAAAGGVVPATAARDAAAVATARAAIRVLLQPGVVRSMRTTPPECSDLNG
jgi:hypothetical protein